MRTLSAVSTLREIKTGPFGTQLRAAEYLSAQEQHSHSVVSVGEIRLGTIEVTAKTPQVGRAVAARLPQYILDSRDVVVSRKGTVDRSAWISPQFGNLFLGSDAIAVRFHDELSARAYGYVMRSHIAREWLVRHAAGSTMHSMNSEILGRLPVPDLDQRTLGLIVEVLGALDDKIAANRRLIDVGRSLLAAHWASTTTCASRTVDLKEVVEIAPRVPKSKTKAAPYLDMKNLPEHGLLVSAWSQREPRGGARFYNGDTLIARITPCFENGKMAWVDFLDDSQAGYGSTEYIVLRSRPGVPSLAPYVIGASPDFRAFAAQHRTGTSGRQRVQASALASYQVRWPDDQQLKAFGRFSEKLVGRLGAARTESRALATARDELLPLLMNGRITVKDAERRVEEEN